MGVGVSVSRGGCALPIGGCALGAGVSVPRGGCALPKGGCALTVGVAVESPGMGVSVGKVVADGVANGGWGGVEVAGAEVGIPAGLHALSAPAATTARKVVARQVINYRALANRLGGL